MNYQRKIFYAFFLLLFLSISFVSGFYLAKQKIEIKKQDIYNTCWQEAKKQFSKPCTPPKINQSKTEIKNFYGTISDINSDKKELIVKPAPLATGENFAFSIIVKISEQTKMKQVIKKDKNNQDGQEKNRINTSPPFFIRQAVDFSNFQKGQVITVTAKEDVRGKRAVDAVEILINYK